MPEAISVSSAMAFFIFISPMLDFKDWIFALAVETETSRAFTSSLYVVSAIASCLRFSSSSRSTVCSRTAYWPAASRLPARRLAEVLARRSRCSASCFFTCVISRSHNPACDASPWLYCAICLRRFSVSTSSSASGLLRSNPETNSPKNPRTRFDIRLNMALEPPLEGINAIVTGCVGLPWIL